MRYMCLMKSSESNGETPPAVYEAMAEYDRWGRANGVLVVSQGLLPSSTGAIVSLVDGNIKAVDGPFTEAKELVAGYWVWQVKSKEEAVEWLKRAPFADGEVELRQVFESDDFGEEFTPELREQEDRLRAQAATNS